MISETEHILNFKILAEQAGMTITGRKPNDRFSYKDALVMY